ncbi:MULTISPECIES: FAD-dependent oxidoreductase [Microbacterium]|uniref:Fumarate reductase flavoprotein subunit n=1 Tax=Microbacterium saccharophilum TaxID=1213358 RepID=A0A7Z7GFN4_9MICO|nr:MULTISPECIES: FAD-dependent oxidoreductase [Microbacterium]SFI61070.1 fumarate reductase flavoprotein subunit [Microbacterium saccharophilum]
MSGQRKVIVVGGGGAGLSAAAMAAEQGADVQLFESENAVGGSTKLSSGIISAGGTSVQRALGVDDSPERFFQHYMDLNQWRLEPALITTFCQEAAPAFEWLLGLGVEVPAAISYNAREPGLNQAGVGDVWRAHVPAGEGEGVVRVLENAISERGVHVALQAHVDRLLMSEGRVTGVLVDGVEHWADAVVVASGGFSHSDELLAEYYPRALESPNLFRVAAPGSRGDHIAFAEQVDASLSGHGRGLLLLAADFQRHHHWEAGFPPKSRIYVGRDGRRFTNEDVSYSVSTGIFDRAGGWCWAVFDEAGLRSLPTGEFLEWTPDVVRREAEKGITAVGADSLGELARLIDVPEKALVKTVERWNSELPMGGVDSEYQREATMKAKGVTGEPDRIAEPPFYAVKIRPSELICTHTGLAINGSAAVRDRFGEVIPGLYAAGEAGGGVLGESYVGGGNSVSNALTMGRVAGRSAASGRS